MALSDTGLALQRRAAPRATVAPCDLRRRSKATGRAAPDSSPQLGCARRRPGGYRV